MAVLFVDGEVLHGEPVAGHVAAHELVLAARDFGDDLAIRMQQVEHGVEIAADWVEQGRAIELGGEDGECAVADGVVGHGAALDVLAIVIDIDALGEPLFDAAEIRGVGEDLVDLGKRGGDHPAVIRRVNAAGRQRPTGLDEEGAQGAQDLAGTVHLGNGGGGADVVDDEAGVGRRVEIRGEEIDVAFGALRAFEESGGEADALDQFARRVVFGLGAEQAGGGGLDQSAGGAGGDHQVVVGNGAEARAGGVGDLRAQEVVERGVVACDNARIDDGRRPCRSGAGGRNRQ